MRKLPEGVVPGLVIRAEFERAITCNHGYEESSFLAPCLIVAARQDSTVGYTDAVYVLDRYPHASLAVIDGEGHALPHEKSKLLTGHLGHWLERVKQQM